VEISRRDLFRASVAVAGVAALGGAGSLSADAVAGTRSVGRLAAPGPTTLSQVLLKSGGTGWQTVVTGPGEARTVRENLGVAAKRSRAKTRKHLLSFAQVSDVHICDAQSPMRLEPRDRKGDPDSGLPSKRRYRPDWRPQEILGVHVADAMVRRINEIGRGPVFGMLLALTLQTGDNADNNQRNEIRWNIDVLDGGTVQVDSGDLTKYEGVQDGDPAYYDPFYWHPDGTPEGLEDDQARTKYGFPTVPGLLDAARAPFEAAGLDIPWFTALGNHDGLPQGSMTPNDKHRAKAVGTQKTITPPNKVRTVSADPDRRELSRKEWVEEHFASPAAPGPVGHGFTAENRTKGTAYYTFDQGLVRFIVLDSVNPNGRASGSIDPEQFSWLRSLLAQSKKKLVILASHHTIGTMNNSLTGALDNDRRVLGAEILPVLLANENVIAWVNGHTHTNHIWAHKRAGGGGFWEINTASHIDWPQQGRLIEIADNKDGTLSIFTTTIDHAGDAEFSGDLEDPVQLAALSRLLSANDWQGQDKNRRGVKTARNVELIAKAPAFLR
jgi:3',5'-cyclic AMP phosphodiesterase CpdA